LNHGTLNFKAAASAAYTNKWAQLKFLQNLCIRVQPL